MQFYRHFLLLPYKIGIKERVFLVQSSANLSKKSILKQKFVISILAYIYLNHSDYISNSRINNTTKT